MSEEYDSKDYFQAMFGEDYHKNKLIDAESDRKRVKAALKLAHEIRQFEISLYWQRSLFFWGFILAFFTGLGLILAAEKQTELIKLMSIGIALLGFFTTCAWYYVEKGSKAWQENWELHIDCLEDDITGKLHKTTLWLDGKKYNFFSASKITRTVIIAFGIFWFLASAFVTCNAFSNKELEQCQVQKQKLLSTMDFFQACSLFDLCINALFPTLIFIIVCFLAHCDKCCLGGHWRTTLDTIPINKEETDPINEEETNKKERTVIGSQRARRFKLE